jgi:acetate---CoA ligase (ADP-forming)
MRAIAAQHGVSDAVAVQAMVGGVGEAFCGLQCQSDLGAVALLGRGGVLVEVSGGVEGRFLPLDEDAIRDLADEVAGDAAFARLRGQKRWPIAAIEDTLRGLDRLWHTNRAWLGSVDINPLIVTESGILAVDALFLAQRC